jgi:hypothetical protein
MSKQVIFQAAAWEEYLRYTQNFVPGTFFSSKFDETPLQKPIFGCFSQIQRFNIQFFTCPYPGI